MAATILAATPTVTRQRTGGGQREGIEASAQGEEATEEGYCRGSTKELIVYVEPRRESELYRRLDEARKEVYEVGVLFIVDDCYTELHRLVASAEL